MFEPRNYYVEHTKRSTGEVSLSDPYKDFFQATERMKNIVSNLFPRAVQLYMEVPGIPEQGIPSQRLVIASWKAPVKPRPRNV